MRNMRVHKVYDSELRRRPEAGRAQDAQGVVQGAGSQAALLPLPVAEPNDDQVVLAVDRDGLAARSPHGERRRRQVGQALRPVDPELAAI